MKPSFCAVLFAASLLAGCAPRPAPLVGTWTGTLSSSLMPGTTYPATETFRADSTESFLWSMEPLQVAGEGRYAQAGDTLTVTPTSFGGRRVYTVALTGDALTLTDKEAGAVLTLRRAP